MEGLVRRCSAVCSLGEIMDGDLTITSHINKLIGICFYSQSNPKIIKSWSYDDTRQQLCDLKSCNTSFADQPVCLLDHIQSALNIIGSRKKIRPHNTCTERRPTLAASAIVSGGVQARFDGLQSFQQTCSIITW